MKLTDLSVRALKTPETGYQIYNDDTLPGFGVRITANGVKSYVLTHGVRRQRETIGRVGILSLQEARSEAKRRLAEYTLGKTANASTTWKSALEEYLAEVERRCRPSTLASYRRHLSSHFRFGDTKLADITPADLRDRLNKLSRRPAEQEHAFTALRAFLQWAYRAHHIDHKPLDRMQKPTGSVARSRTLSDDELKAVWNALEDNTFGRIVKLLILTGQRETEIAHLTPDMIKGDEITLPSWLTKNKREHTFPIGSISLSIFTKSQSKELTSYLFPARGSNGSLKLFSGWSKCKKALDKRSGVNGWRLHDLRRTFRTKWEELGIQPTVAERYINHVSGVHSGVQGIYNRYKYLPEMQLAVSHWEKHLTNLTRPVRLVAA
jgi:integrase